LFVASTFRNLTAYRLAAELADEVHNETEHWLLRAQTRSLPTPDTDERLDELARTLNGLVKTPTPR
jgi:hypothetical protein